MVRINFSEAYPGLKKTIAQRHLPLAEKPVFNFKADPEKLYKGESAIRSGFDAGTVDKVIRSSDGKPLRTNIALDCGYKETMFGKVINFLLNINNKYPGKTKSPTGLIVEAYTVTPNKISKIGM